MKQILFYLFIVTGFTSLSQFPLADSWHLNTDGTLAVYEHFPGMPPTTETVEMTDSADVLQVCYNDDYVYIRTNGLPSYLMGPWNMNPNEPEAHMSTYRIPRNPMEEMGDNEPQPFGGAIGIAVNGVKLYGSGDARSYDASMNENNNMGDGLWNGDAWASEGETMDATGVGHPDGGGNYHYHATPIYLYDETGSEHSGIIGWAFDGFPIYGPYGYEDPLDETSDIVRIESSYRLRDIDNREILPDGSPSVPPGPSDFIEFPLGTYWEDFEYVDGLGHLNEFNGRVCKTPDFDEPIFAYFITMTEEGEPAYPYITGPSYYGEVNPMDIGPASGDATIPGDVFCVDPETSSIESNPDPLDYIVYPNPATSVLNVLGKNGYDYRIINQLGQEVMSGINFGQIDISMLENGTYILNMDLPGEAAYVRFVKQ